MKRIPCGHILLALGSGVIQLALAQDPIITLHLTGSTPNLRPRMRARITRRLITKAAAAILAIAPLAQAGTVTVTVPGTSNPWLAGTPRRHHG